MNKHQIILCAATAALGSLATTTPAADPDNAPARYENYKAAQVVITDHDQLHLIESFGGIVANCRVGVGPLDVILPPDALGPMREAGIATVILHDNIQQVVNAEKRRLRGRMGRTLAVAACDATWFEDFKTFPQIQAKLDELAAHPSGLATKFPIGTSHEGRTIWALRISQGDDLKPAAFFNGTQHAREWVSPMVNIYIADRLICTYGTDPQVTALLDDTEVFIIPVINPDGYVYSWTDERWWRKNRRNNFGSCEGVDLNRNWSTDWNGGESNSSDTCSSIYIGLAPFSEPESAAVRDFFLARPQIAMHIDFHAYSQLILEPWGHTNQPWPNHAETSALGADMASDIFAVHGRTYLHGNGDINGELYLASGVMQDYTSSQGAYGFTFELRPTGFPFFELPPEEIIPNAEEVFPAAMRLIAEAALRTPPCPADCAPPGGNGVINVDDLFEVINGISTQSGACDIAPNNGDGTVGNAAVNFDDIIEVVNRFGSCPK